MAPNGAPVRLEACLKALRERDRSVALDLKEGGDVVERVLSIATTLDFDQDSLWFNGSIEVLGESGIQRLAEAYPAATISVPVDFLGPLLLAAPAHAREVLATLRSWGVNRWSLDWRTTGIRELMDYLEEGGWPVNIYGIPDLEAFLEASLLLPRSVRPTSTSPTGTTSAEARGSTVRITATSSRGTRWRDNADRPMGTLAPRPR